MWVKVCGLTREDDLEAALEAGVDAVGFVLAASPRQLTPARARELGARAAGRAITVAVVVDPASIPTGFGAVQVHGQVPELPAGMRVIRALEPDEVADDARADWLMVDGSRGTGKVGDWASLGARVWPAPLILSGGLRPENVVAAARAVQPFGVDVSSGIESAPGRKDHARLRAFVEAARGL